MKRAFLACALMALAGLLCAQAFTLHLNAFDVAEYDSGNPFPNDSPFDLQASILFNGAPFDPPIHTPYLFGATGNLPFVPGVYSVDLEGWMNWFPESLTFIDIITDYEVDFLGQQLPPNVVISSFEAQVVAPNDVLLTWISEYETNLIGYRIYRNVAEDLPGALQIGNLIPATNTSQPQTYQFHDLEVDAGNTYYYWLEAVDLDGLGTFFGPVSVYISGTGAVDELQSPPLDSSRIEGIWPNPGKLGGSTRVDVSIKGSERGSLRICNLRGQIVKSFDLGQGRQQVVWDGRDKQGIVCPSGVYLYRLCTPDTQSVGKQAIVK